MRGGRETVPVRINRGSVDPLSILVHHSKAHGSETCEKEYRVFLVVKQSRDRVCHVNEGSPGVCGGLGHQQQRESLRKRRPF